MMKLFRAALCGLLIFGLTPAVGQVSKSALNSQTSSNFPDNSTGAITPAIIRTFMGSVINSFQQYAGVNPQAGTTYTIQATDYGQLITFNNVAPVAVTLPQATGSFASFNTYVRNIGAGTVTITPTTSLINGAATLVLTTSQSAWIISDATDYQTWFAPSTAISCSAFPALTGDTTTSAGSCVTTTGKVNGVSYSGTVTSGGVPCYSSTSTAISSSLLTLRGVLVGGGAGACPTAVAAGGAGTLLVGVTSAAPVMATMSQDCAIGSTGVITCTKTNNVSFGTYATATQGQLPGIASNTAATAGNIDEPQTSNAASPGTSITTTAAKDVTTVSITAGAWRCTGNVWIIPAGTITLAQAWTSTTANTTPTAPNAGGYLSTGTIASTNQVGMSAGTQSFLVNGPTTVSLGVNATFSATATAYGFLECRRSH